MVELHPITDLSKVVEKRAKNHASKRRPDTVAYASEGGGKMKINSCRVFEQKRKALKKRYRSRGEMRATIIEAHRRNKLKAKGKDVEKDMGKVEEVKKSDASDSSVKDPEVKKAAMKAQWRYSLMALQGVIVGVTLAAAAAIATRQIDNAIKEVSKKD